MGETNITGSFVPIYLDPGIVDMAMGRGWRTVRITDNAGEPWTMRVFTFQEPSLLDHIPKVDFKTGKASRSNLPWWVLIDKTIYDSNYGEDVCPECGGFYEGW